MSKPPIARACFMQHCQLEEALSLSPFRPGEARWLTRSSACWLWPASSYTTFECAACAVRAPTPSTWRNTWSFSPQSGPVNLPGLRRCTCARHLVNYSKPVPRCVRFAGALMAASPQVCDAAGKETETLPVDGQVGTRHNSPLGLHRVEAHAPCRFCCRQRPYLGARQRAPTSCLRTHPAPGSTPRWCTTKTHASSS